MKRYTGITYLLFVYFLVASPISIIVDANYAPAQTSVSFSDELLENPDFNVEPYVEIGSFSPEFDYEYTSVGDAGSVSLIWMHTAGHELNFESYYPPECYEYAKLSQPFALEVNKSVLAVKASVSFDIECTGDFATVGLMDNMWEVNLEIHHAYMHEPYRLRTLSGLQNGDTDEIEIITTKFESERALYSGIPLIYLISVELTPTYNFMQTVGNISPWANYSGSIICTIDHMSVKAMYEGSSLAPLILSPKYNTTEFSNATSEMFGIESSGYSSIFQVRRSSLIGYSREYNLLALSSDHQTMWNKSMALSSNDLGYLSYVTCAATNERLATISSFSNETAECSFIQCYDSFGNVLWNRTELLFYLDLPLNVEIDSVGNVIVFVLSLRSNSGFEYPDNQQIVYSIMKLNPQGIRVWNKTIWIQNYAELVASGGLLKYATGFECSGENIFIGNEDQVEKYDSDGNLEWSRDYPHSRLCADPRGGCYTYSQKYDSETEFVRWDNNGNTVWSKALGWDYGSGWIEYPFLQEMTVGPSGPLYLVLGYDRIYPCTVLMRITRTGQVLSQETILEGYETEYSYTSYRPHVIDMAITGDGLVHLMASSNYLYYYYPEYYYPGSIIPGNILLTYELPGSTPISPISIAMGGIASVLILGIAYDYFFRRGSVPEPPAEPSISDFEW
ncbi:MAG: hypothetical protein RTV72_01355 [Candidatus Thorarchaeota archaeon]